MPDTVQLRFQDALQPISDASPSGAYLAADGPILRELDDQRNAIDASIAQWLADEQARVPTAPQGSDNGSEAEQLGAINSRLLDQLAGDQHRGDWLNLQRRLADVLAHDSKDLRLLTRFVEASAYAEGFPGVADALDFVTAALTQFWDSIHPVAADAGVFQDYLDERRQLLAWFNEPKDGLPNVVTAIPLSATPDGDQVALRHLLAAAKHFAGWPSAERVRTALKRTPDGSLRSTHAALTRCLAAATHLDETISTRLGPTTSAKLRDRLHQCRTLVEEMLPAASRPAPGPQRDEPQLAKSGPAPVAGDRESPAAAAVDRLRRLQDRARDARSPRDEFLSQIAVAEACLEADLYWLAVSVLESVFATIDAHALGRWERRDVLDRVVQVVEGCRRAAQAQGHESPRLDRLTKKADALNGATVQAEGRPR